MSVTMFPGLKAPTDRADHALEVALNTLGWTRHSGITGSYWTHPNERHAISGSMDDVLSVLSARTRSAPSLSGAPLLTPKAVHQAPPTTSTPVGGAALTLATSLATSISFIRQYDEEKLVEKWRRYFEFRRLYRHTTEERARAARRAAETV